MLSVLGTALVARKVRVAVYCAVGAAGLLVIVLGGLFFAVGRVLPFYQQALAVEPEVLQRASREFESQATALYSDARQAGEWQALFTADQINGWLAFKLEEFRGDERADRIRDPRVAITPEFATLGFRTTSGGVETVVSVDAAPMVTEEGSIAIRLQAVRAGALPLPVMQLADELADACQSLRLPVRWIQQEGQPVAMVAIDRDASNDKRHYFVDMIKLGDGELFVSGHTELTERSVPLVGDSFEESADFGQDVTLDVFDPRPRPPDERSASDVAHRLRSAAGESAATAER